MLKLFKIKIYSDHDHQNAMYFLIKLANIFFFFLLIK